VHPVDAHHRLRRARVPAPLVRPGARRVRVDARRVRVDTRRVQLVRATADGLDCGAGALATAAASHARVDRTLATAAESHARDGRMGDGAARVLGFARNAGV
jgi:hypothetical protein